MRSEPLYVYAIGQVEYRFSRLSIEKELAQAASAENTASLTDQAVVVRALQSPANRYIARQMCWVLTVEGLETYLLVPRDSTDLDLLLRTLREEPSRTDAVVVIGVRGPVAPPDLCNGLTLPMVRAPTLYAKTAEQYARDFSLTAVQTRPSHLSQGRRITDVVLSYTHRTTDFTEKWFLRVDVTEEFPFLVTKLSPYYDR